MSVHQSFVAIFRNLFEVQYTEFVINSEHLFTLCYIFQELFSKVYTITVPILKSLINHVTMGRQMGEKGT
jgi:hypothetical protein